MIPPLSDTVLRRDESDSWVESEREVGMRRRRVFGPALLGGIVALWAWGCSPSDDGQDGDDRPDGHADTRTDARPNDVSPPSADSIRHVTMDVEVAPVFDARAPSDGAPDRAGRDAARDAEPLDGSTAPADVMVDSAPITDGPGPLTHDRPSRSDRAELRVDAITPLDVWIPDPPDMIPWPDVRRLDASQPDMIPWPDVSQPDVRRPDVPLPDALPQPSDVARPDAVVVVVEPVECVESVVRVGDVEIFAYEASRPDATEMSSGEDGARACSRAGVVPWVNVALPTAVAACAASGFHVCAPDEWEAICSNQGRRMFPYGHGHRRAVCNDHVSGSGALEVTGNRPECVTPEGVFDLSGNVWEWTDNHRRRGASYRVNAAAFQVDAASCVTSYFCIQGYFDVDVGFRCCRLGP